MLDAGTQGLWSGKARCGNMALPIQMNITYSHRVSKSERDGEWKPLGDRHDQNGHADDKELDKLLNIFHLPRFLVDNKEGDGEVKDEYNDC